MVLLAVALIAAGLTVATSTPVVRAVGAPTHEPLAWGSRLTGTKAYGAWGSPVTGTSALSSSSPSGGGTLGARDDGAGPLTKLRDMVSFGGGSVEAFAEGGTASSSTGHMLARVRNSAGEHEVWGWGYNTSGQLGTGTLVSSNAPVKTLWTPRVGEVVEQLAVGLAHSLMLTRQGATRRVYAWGVNTYGQLGIAALSMSSRTRQTTPRLIDTLTAENIVSIAAGHSHSVAAAADGSVWVWGWDAPASSTSYGNLGVSGTTARPVPVKMTDDSVNARRATPTTYSITNNVLTVNTSARHHFDVGDTVVQSLGDPELDGARTITKVTATSYSVLAQPNVVATATTGALTVVLPTATPSAASIADNVATLSLSGAHDLRVGNVVDVAIGDPAFDGRRTITGRTATSISYTSQPNVASAPLASPGVVAFANADPVTVTHKAITSNVATLTVPTGHPFARYNLVTVDIGDPTFDGTFELTSGGTATTIRYNRTAANVTTTPVATGTVTLNTPTVSVTNLAISSNTAVLTADASGPAHNFRTGNQVIVSGLGGNLDGPKAITAFSVANRTLSLQAQPNVTSTPVNGTVAMARDSDTITAYSVSSNVAAVTVTSGHDFEVGNQIVITGLPGNLGGTKTITNVAASTVSYAVRPNQTATAATGAPTAVVTDCSVACPVAPTDVVEVAAGGAYTLARTSAGQVISWGYVNTKSYGRIGRIATATPLAVALPAGCVAVQIAAGTASSGAVCANGTIATWGYNGLSNLGTNRLPPNASDYVAAPAVVSGLSLGAGETIVDLDIETAGMAVLTSTGAVWSWGAGAHGRIGRSGVTTNQHTAQSANRVDPPGSPTSSALFSMNYTSGVADTTGVVWTWGYGGYGLTGRGISNAAAMRFDRIGIDPTTRIAMWDTTYYASVVVMSDGSMWTWGSNGGVTTTYFLGDGTTGGRLTPGKIDLPVGIDTSLAAHSVTSLDCSYNHCLFTTSNGSIYGWGDAYYRQITLNATTDRRAPTLIKSGLVNPRVAAGNGYSLYVDIGASGTGGRVYAWGLNSGRRAAPNSSVTGSLTTFTEVKDMVNPSAPGTVTDVIAISAGNSHSVALRADGTIMTWGLNTSGQMGAGNAVSSVYYHQPTLSAGAVAADVHAEGDHVLVRATDGRLFGWGRNTNGVLGSGSTTNLVTPTHVAAAYRFARVDTAGHPTLKQIQSTVGLTVDGQVLAWGSNVYGQLGRPDRPNASSGVNSFSSTPVAVLTSTSTPVTGVDVVVAGGWWSAGYHLYQAPLPPTPPQSLAVTSPAPHTLHLTWTAPATPRELLGYEITVSRHGVEVFTAGAAAAATSLTLAAPEVDVIDGAAHDVVIRAVNAVGLSDPDGPATATPIGPPGAATSVSAVSQPGGFDVSLDAPVDTGGSPPTQAVLVATPVDGGAAVTVTAPWGATPLVVPMTTADGLILDTEYEVAVTVHNVVGPGPSVTSNAVVPGRPGAPLHVAAAGRAGEAYVTWQAPVSDGGLPIQSYVVTTYTAGTRTSVSAMIVTGGLFEATVSGLTDGVVYDVDVRASQAADGLSGRGVRSATVSVTAGRPVAPASVDVTRSAPGALTITWPAVADVPGITVTSYDVRTDDGTSVVTTSVSCATDPCSTVRTGLTNGRLYRVQVAAVSAAGAGPWTTAVARKPRTVPQPPTSLVVEPSNGTASLVFDPPGDDGGDDLDAYLVEITPTAGGAAVWSGTLGTLETSTAIDGLTNGTSYTVTVKARNGAGPSAPQTAVVVPATTPGAPNNVRVRPGSIIVEWDAPADDGGNPVSRYEITVTDTDGISTTVETSAAAECSTSLRYCRIQQVKTATSNDGLTDIPPDMTYTIVVVAVNEQGSGEPTVEVALVASQPSEPVTVGATAGLESLELCWATPLSVPGSATISAYQMTFDDGTDVATLVVPVADLDPAPDCAAPSIGHRVTAFDDGSAPGAGTTYTVQIAASISTEDYVFGIQSAAVSATPYTFPGAPTAAGATAVGGAVTVTWSAASGGGTTVSSYTVTATPGGDTCTWTTGPLECTIVGLADGVAYTFEVVATNAAGDGPALSTAAVTVDAAGPVATWTSTTVIDDDTVDLVVTFDEAMSDLTLADLSTPTGSACTLALPSVGTASARVRLRCAPGAAVVRLAALAVIDGSANRGPVAPVDSPTVTFTAATTTTTMPPVAPPTTAAPTTTTVPPATSTSTTTAPPTTAPFSPVPATDRATDPAEVSARVVVAGACIGACPGTAQTSITLVVPGVLEIGGADLQPGSPIEVWLYSEPTLLGRLVVDANGEVNGRLDLPAVEPGDHTLEVMGTDDRGTPFVLRMATEVVGPVPTPSGSPTLPATGTDPGGHLVVVLLLLATGLLLVLWARRITPNAARQVQPQRGTRRV